MRIAINPLIISLLRLLTITLLTANLNCVQDNGSFNPQRAYQDVVFQVNLGPRTMGSSAHEEAKNYIVDVLEESKWSVEIQTTTLENGYKIENIIAHRKGSSPLVLLGAHYDSRFYSDNDPDPVNHQEATPGANDGASGVAVLLELARVLPREMDIQVEMVFFDAEDNGHIPGFDWIMGSQYFADNIDFIPEKVVIVDMVGDKDLNLYLEKNSDPKTANEIWQTAIQLGYTQFIMEEKHRILDDHVPFINKGIPAVDIIDFDYPYWHTTQDTVDKVSSESLAAVGITLMQWLTTYPLP